MGGYASKVKRDVSYVPEDTEFTLAKSFLNSKVGGKTVSFYDHLTSIVNHVLETRSQASLDNFEALSAELKRSRFQAEVPGAPTSLRDASIPTPDIVLAKKQSSLFQRVSAEEAAEKAAADIGEIPDIMDLANLWDGLISFGREETFVLFLSIKNLVEEKPLKSVRLWGKIFGTQSNYIIVEAELKDGAADDDDAIANAVEDSKAATEPAAGTKAAGEDDEAKGDQAIKSPEEDETGLPKPKNKPLMPLSKEARIGVNKYVYYATSYAGGVWTRLPDVIPEKLQAARRIRKYFTGNLKAHIDSYPAFDGTEAHYLRAQIARISSATVLSPNGYYMIDSEEAEAEEGAGGPSIIINPEFEGLANDQLLNLANWVHHVPYILPQGRVTWENPVARAENAEGGDDEDREEEEASEENAADNIEPESGPAPLSVITADDEHGDLPSWISRTCSHLSPTKFSPVMLRSTRWPGATVVAYNDKFANIYMGDGLKDLGNPLQRFVPPKLGDIQKEYATGEGADGNAELLVEQTDPTIEQEKAYEDEKRAKEAEGKEGGSDGEENAEGDEDEE
ncbi:radial spokehead-like protein [Entophlyctis helioformis]|nr:radial spokehead-like protein [Entophlyctis helioformis]